MGTVLVKRVLIDEFVIPDATSASYDNPVEFDLLACSEGQAEPIESTGGTTAGTDVAQIPLYSKLAALKLNFTIRSTGTKLVRWMLVKNENNEYSAANFMTNFHNSDESAAAREVRKLILSKGLISISADKLQSRIPVFVKRQALKRIQSFKEDDKLTFVAAANTEGANQCTLSGFGSLYVKANA